MATFSAYEPDAPYIRVHRIEADFYVIPETPFSVKVYESLWLALEPYAKLRAKGRDAWIVTLDPKRTLLVRRK